MGKKSGNLVLTAALRVKNEEANLPRCLANLEKFCDHIVAYDDGSTDRTLEILNDHPLVRHVVSMDKDFYHETHDRSIALALAALTKPDWILRIDPDEEFEERAVREVRNLLSIEGYKAWSLKRFNFVGDEQHGDLAEEHWCLFRYVPGKVFYYNIKLHFAFPCIDKVPGKWGRTSLRVKHFGYVDKEAKIEKSRKEGYHFGDYLTPYFEWEEGPNHGLLYREVPRPWYYFTSQSQIAYSPIDAPADDKRYQNISEVDLWLLMAENFVKNLAPVEAARSIDNSRKLIDDNDFTRRTHLRFCEGLLDYTLARWESAGLAFKDIYEACRIFWPFMAAQAKEYLARIKSHHTQEIVYPRDPDLVDGEWLKERYLPWFIKELERRKPKNVFLFGAGRHSMDLDDIGFFHKIEVAGIVDDQPEKKAVNKVPIMTLDEAKKRDDGLLIISTDRYEPQLIERFQKEDIGSLKLQPLYGTLGDQPFWFDERTYR